MKFLNQRGTIDLHILMIALVVMLTGGFVAFRVISGGDEQQNTETTAGDSLVADADSDADDIDGAESIDEESDESLSTNDESNPAAPNPESEPGATEVNFVKGGIGLSPDSPAVRVVAAMSQNQSGTCTFTFSLNGTPRVIKTTTLSNQKSCEIDVDVSEFPKSATYIADVDFESNDGSIFANVSGFSIDVIPETFNFTKGGGNYDGTNVVISETSTDAHTGTCNYVFILGNSRVEKSNDITNSRTCSITIPGSEFPKSGNWDYTLTFNGTTSFVVGSGGGYQIEIN